MREFLGKLADPAFAAPLLSPVGEIANLSAIDGLRFSFRSGDVLHYRASGNAPELRCYSEAASAARADWVIAFGLETARRQVG